MKYKQIIIVVTVFIFVFLTPYAEGTSLRHRHRKDHKYKINTADFDLPSIDTSDFVLSRFSETKLDSTNFLREESLIPTAIVPRSNLPPRNQTSSQNESSSNTPDNSSINHSNVTVINQSSVESSNHSSDKNITGEHNQTQIDNETEYHPLNEMSHHEKGDSQSRNNSNVSEYSNSSGGNESFHDNNTNPNNNSQYESFEGNVSLQQNCSDHNSSGMGMGNNDTNNSDPLNISADASNSSLPLILSENSTENSRLKKLGMEKNNSKSNIKAKEISKGNPVPLKLETVVKQFEEQRGLIKISKKFRMLSSNPAFEPLLTRLTEFNNEIKRIGAMNQMIYEKLNNSLVAFNDLKQHIGLIQRGELQNLISNYTSGENIIKQEAKIVSTDIKKLKKDMINFYNSNVENVNSSQSDLEDLVNIKKSLLEQIKKTKALTKINFLQIQILDKLRTIITEFQNSLIKETFRNEAKVFYHRLNRIHSHYYAVHPMERVVIPVSSRTVFYQRIPQTYMIKNLVKIDECI